MCVYIYVHRVFWAQLSIPMQMACRLYLSACTRIRVHIPAIERNVSRIIGIRFACAYIVRIAHAYAISLDCTETRVFHG